MDEIEVKLSPLDEDSKQALESFVNAIGEVKDSMDEIKKAFETQLVDFKSILTKVSANPPGGGGGGGLPLTKWQGESQIPQTPSGSASSGSSTARASTTTPDSSVSGGNTTPNVDQGGHGGTTGGGGTSDPTMGYPYPGRPSAEHLPKNAGFYDQSLQIPRINEFNIQDYTRMAGKVIAGGGPLDRYKQNYQDAYQENRNRGMDHNDAASAASQYADAEMSRGDAARTTIAGGLATIGKTGPYLAATENLMPQLLTGPGGLFGAGGLSANMNAQMGVGGTPTGIAESVAAPFQAASAAFRGERAGSGNEAAYRFGAMLGAGVDGASRMSPDQILNTKALQLFSMQERGAFAEASIETNMRGGEFDTFKNRYTNRRMNAQPTLAPGQYIELARDQTRYGDVSSNQAADNLDRLADSALQAGMNVKQMGEGAQQMKETFGQLTMAQATRQTAAYGAAGINPQTATSILSTPALTMGAYKAGVLPDMLPFMKPSEALPIMGGQYDQMKAMYTSMAQQQGMSPTRAHEFVQAMLARSGINAPTQLVLNNHKGYEALANAEDNLGGSKESLRAQLEQVQLPGGKNGKPGKGPLKGFTDAQINTIVNAEGKDNRQKALEKVFKNYYGYDVKSGDKIVKDAQDAMKGDSGNQGGGKLTAMIDLTGKAAQYFQIVDQHMDKPSGTDPHRTGTNINPLRGVGKP